MIDAIYIVPAVALTIAVIVAYFPGIEVGRDRGRREQIARDRHPSSKYVKVRKSIVRRRNVKLIQGGK